MPRKKNIFLVVFFFFLSFIQNIYPSEINFNETDIRNSVDSVWIRYYANHLNSDGSLQNAVASQLSWRGSVATMMFSHAYKVLGDVKYLHYAEQSYLVANSQWSDDLAWAANSALEILQHLKNAPPAYQSLRSQEYYRKDIADIYHTLTTPLGNSIGGQTKSYDTFSLVYVSPDTNGQTKNYSAMMWSTNPTWGLSDPQFNTCSLGQSVVLAYQMSADESLATHESTLQASQWLNTQLDNLINFDSGIVYDHIKLTKNPLSLSQFFYRKLDTREFTYNTGTVLAALGLQDNFPSTDTFISNTNKIKLYENIFNRIQSKFTKNSVLTEFDTNPEFSSYDTYGGDHAAFKGVFMHFLPYFYFSKTMQDTNAQELQNEFKSLVKTSANAAWEQLKNNNFTASYDWNSFNFQQTNCITTISAVESLLTAWELLNIQKIKQSFDDT